MRLPFSDACFARGGHLFRHQSQSHYLRHIYIRARLWFHVKPTPHKNLLRHGKHHRTQVSLNWLFMLLWDKGLNYVIAEGFECCLGLIILADDHHQIIFPIYGSSDPHSGCPPTISNSDFISEGFQEKTPFLVDFAQMDTFWTFDFLQNQCKYS